MPGRRCAWGWERLIYRHYVRHRFRRWSCCCHHSASMHFVNGSECEWARSTIFFASNRLHRHHPVLRLLLLPLLSGHTPHKQRRIINVHVTPIDKYESVVMRFKDKNCIQNYEVRGINFLLVSRVTAKIVSIYTLTYISVCGMNLYINVRAICSNSGMVHDAYREEQRDEADQLKNEYGHGRAF